ncbi:6672_t:CDS:2 [Diversispora eburnea]|uniref:6672_t:CDS:1 n=1 Tax=Diversispora eburnea TaxID=1213867 RepID=A0A9N8V3U6_9GLOM|nr:6672_t:CDS:2 [Diversispora eburnea]
MNSFIRFDKAELGLVLDQTLPGTRVMFLHDHLFSNGLYNGSIEVVLEILDEENIIVAFPLTQENSLDEQMLDE